MHSSKDSGVALLGALITLALFTLLGFYMSFNAVNDLRISDNHESEIRASFAARAGLNHARELIRGLPLDELLKGPDNAYNTAPSYIAQARTFGFRNPLNWTTASALNIYDPFGEIAGLPDDGLMNTGFSGTSNGTVLIPLEGIAQMVPNPYGSGMVVTSRYFVKVTDNNGEASELAKDPGNNPFVDGDGVIIIRSMGVARSIRETVGAAVRENSVAVVEGRFKRLSTFTLDAPLVVQGSAVLPSVTSMFDGIGFSINGGSGMPGIATIDVNLTDGVSPSYEIASRVAVSQGGCIQGTGGSPSITDITASVVSDPDKALLLNPSYLDNFTKVVGPRFADNVYRDNQAWSDSTVPDIGTYDISVPLTDPSQKPLVTIVDGDLSVDGTITGGGLLVVRGKLNGCGRLAFNGLVLVVGAGNIDLSCMTLSIRGGVYVTNLVNNGGVLTFGTPRLSISGESTIHYDAGAISIGVSLIPPVQLGWREITSNLDP